MEDDKSSVDPGTLSARLRARGAKPHSRMSDLSRYMLEHYDEIRALVAVERFAWPDIAALLADEEGFADDQGRPVSGNAAKLAYSRIGKLRRPGEPSSRARSSRPIAPKDGMDASPETGLSILSETLPQSSIREPVEAVSEIQPVAFRQPLLPDAAPGVVAPLFQETRQEPAGQDSQPDHLRTRIPLPKLL